MSVGSLTFIDVVLLVVNLFLVSQNEGKEMIDKIAKWIGVLAIILLCVAIGMNIAFLAKT